MHRSFNWFHQLYIQITIQWCHLYRPPDLLFHLDPVTSPFHSPLILSRSYQLCTVVYHVISFKRSPRFKNRTPWPTNILGHRAKPCGTNNAVLVTCTWHGETFKKSLSLSFDRAAEVVTAQFHNRASLDFFLLRLGYVPQAILFILAVDFEVSCSKIPRRAFAEIRTHYPLVESPTS
jgi:hypothetical protein